MTVHIAAEIFHKRSIWYCGQVHATKDSKFYVPHDESVYIAGDPRK
jgi:hypothetical protein